MKDLLGFAVLSGPLWLILAMLCIAIWVAAKAAKRFERRSAKIAVRLLVFLFVFFVAFADEVVGRIYLSYLCATEAGSKVYQTVELPAEYWDERGTPKFFNTHGYLERDFWVKKLDESGGRVERYSSLFSVDKDISPVKERTSQELLAEVTTFRYWGGWIRRNFSPHKTANSCEFIGTSNFSRAFYSELFKPATPSK